jgi:hypothetical protein
MCPPGRENGQCLRELMAHPEQWEQTRASIDVIGYADHALNREFTDGELKAFFPMLKQWKIGFGLEVGAVKPWGKTGAKVFEIDQKLWQRFERLGASIQAIAMDEPLCCCRKDLHESDEYAVRETASFIALVRKNYPNVQIGEIEPYPYIPLDDQFRWIDALQQRLADLHVRGLDFYRLDVNWAEFTVFDRGSWPEVRKIERYCRQHKLPFSLIYWASGYPGVAKRGLASDATWYVGVMQQGYDYAIVDGKPDQYVVQSWIDAPARSLPEAGEFTFTRSVRDFLATFVKRD